MLYAKCFLPRQRNAVDHQLTGRELVVQRNPAEISDLTDDMIRRSSQQAVDNVAGPENILLEEDREMLENIAEDIPNIEERQQQGGVSNVPLGIVDIFDEDDTEREEALDEMSNQSQPLFEEQNGTNEKDPNGAVNRDVEHGTSRKKQDIVEESPEIVVASNEGQVDSVPNQSKNPDQRKENGLERADRVNALDSEPVERRTTRRENSEKRTDLSFSQDNSKKGNDNSTEPESGVPLLGEDLETQPNGVSANCQPAMENMVPGSQESENVGLGDTQDNGQGGKEEITKVCNVFIMEDCVPSIPKISF